MEDSVTPKEKDYRNDLGFNFEFKKVDSEYCLKGVITIGQVSLHVEWRTWAGADDISHSTLDKKQILYCFHQNKRMEAFDVVKI